jgi:hypothetical protein
MCAACTDIRAPADQDAAVKWAEQLKSQFDGVEMVLTVVPFAAEQLVSRMVRRGYDVGFGGYCDAHFAA